MKDYNEDRDKKRKIFFVLLILVVLIIVFFHNPILNTLSTNLLNNNNFEEKNKIEIKLNDEPKVNMINESIVLYENNNLKTIDYKGNIIWEKNIDSDLDVKLGQGNIIITNKSKGSIELLDEKGNIKGSLNLDKLISNVYIKNEFVLAYTKNKDNLDDLILINENEEIINDIIIESGNLLSGYISTNNEYIAITILDISKGILEGRIKLYNLEGDMIWESTYIDEIIQSVNFINNNLVITTDQKIRCINNNKLLWSKNLKKSVKDILVNNNIIYVLIDDTLQLLDKNGKVIFHDDIGKNHFKLYKNNDNIFIVGENSIKTTDKNGKIFSDYYSKEKINDFLIHDDRYLIIKEDEITINGFSK